LVLVMDASAMPKGDSWQKEIARLAIKKLAPEDEVGILCWGPDQNAAWHIPLKPIGGDREAVLGKVDSLQPDRMPDLGPVLRLAHNALRDPQRELVARHVIVISNGYAQQTDATVLEDLKSTRISVTTVGVPTHGPPRDQPLEDLAKATGGRYYKTTNPS